MTHKHNTIDQIITCEQTECTELLRVPRSNANPDGDPNGPLDVWLKFDTPECEESSHEANVYYEHDTDLYRLEWYNTAVGLVTVEHFNTYREATDALESSGYIDFTVYEN